MNDDLDDWLAASRPLVAVRGAEVRHAIEEVITERVPRRLRRRRPLITTSIIGLALLGGGASLAAATPSLLTWFGLTDNTISYSKGEESCAEGFRVVDMRDPDSESASVIAAREFLQHLDIDSVDGSEYLEITKGMRNAESAALGLAVQDVVIEHVAERGLPTDGLTVEHGGACGPVDR